MFGSPGRPSVDVEDATGISEVEIGIGEFEADSVAAFGGVTVVVSASFGVLMLGFGQDASAQYASYSARALPH